METNNQNNNNTSSIFIATFIGFAIGFVVSKFLDGKIKIPSLTKKTILETTADITDVPKTT